MDFRQAIGLSNLVEIGCRRICLTGHEAIVKPCHGAIFYIIFPVLAFQVSQAQGRYPEYVGLVQQVCNGIHLYYMGALGEIHVLAASEII